jgi:tetratricopeptide (TPR) repeat protein
MGSQPRCFARLAGPVLAAALATIAAAAQVPPLPELPLAAYPDRTRQAVAPLYEAAKARPTDAAAAGALGRELQAWNQLEDAHAAYQRAKALATKAFEWTYLDAIVLGQLARHEEAVGEFERALAISPDYVPAQIKLADGLVRLGRYEEARPRFEALRQRAMTAPFGEYGLGQIAAAAGQHERAASHFERAVLLFPEWGEAHYALALAYDRLGRSDDARRAMTARLKYGATGPGVEDPVLGRISSLRDDAVAHLERGVKLDQQGDVAGAIAAHEAAVARDPSFAQAHLNLLLLYGRQQHWEKLEEHYQKAVALGFSLADVHYNYGYAQQQQGRWDQAEAAYRRALEADPLHAEAHVNLGVALERRKDLPAAAGELRRAVEVQPTLRVARFHLARVLLMLGQPKDAIAQLEQTLEPQDGQSGLYLHLLSIAYAEAGNLTEAVRRAEAARGLAAANGQTELVQAIDQTLARLKELSQ